MTTGLSDFFRFNQWANLTLLDACAGLSDTQLDWKIGGGTFGSVRETLQHLVSSEEDYAHTLTGRTPEIEMDESSPFPGFDDLKARVRGAGETLIAYVEQVDAAKLGQTMLLDAGTYVSPRFIMVIQVIDHGIDHRSQVCTLLTQQGIEPPELDAWGYNDDAVTGRGVNP